MRVYIFIISLFIAHYRLCAESGIGLRSPAGGSDFTFNSVPHTAHCINENNQRNSNSETVKLASNNPLKPVVSSSSKSSKVQGTVLISEIFPRGRVDQPEWIELFNYSEDWYDLQNWSYGTTEDTVLITDTTLLLGPGDFVVVTRRQDLLSRRYPLVRNIIQPPQWQAFNNSNDTLYLFSSNGQLIDIACYSSSWFRGWSSQSIQRTNMNLSGLDQRSWMLSEDPTPGAPNRTVTFNTPSLSLDIGPLPFKPNGDGKDDYLLILPQFPSQYTAQITIYGFDGREIVSIEAPNNAALLWDGLCANGRTISPGPFFVVAEFTSTGGYKRYLRKKGVLWR
ncbi:lamin tail domain-containing protein [Chitinispirillales bacterium ANBcel5]|uniref:lamin tail domain-containing protein n=1 Tax=Cellulosispirillum alkaliphilum TaxID=3039283 RepID=UPI002A54FA04|nr:lamin tail domain-containing protein [Chitinispirillales bacterium ANBcel5]